jgi:hypothetical protein
MNMLTRREAVAAVGAAAITLIADQSARADEPATITDIVPAINKKGKTGSKHFTFAIKGTNLTKNTKVTATWDTDAWDIDDIVEHGDEKKILLLRMKKKGKDSKTDERIKQIQEITVTVTNGTTAPASMKANMVVYEDET